MISKSKITRRKPVSKASSRPKSSHDSFLGKRTATASEEPEESGIEQEEPLLEQAGALFDSLNDRTLKKARELRVATTQTLGTSLQQMNAASSEWVTPPNMDAKRDAKLRKLPGNAVKMVRVLSGLNQFTGELEENQLELVEDLRDELPKRQRRNMAANDGIGLLKSRPHHVEAGLFMQRCSLDLELRQAMSHHTSLVQKLGSDLQRPPVLCLKCWAIIFIKDDGSLLLDKATGARVSVPARQVFVFSNKPKKMKAKLKPWVQCSKLLLPPIPQQPSQQDFYPHVVLPEKVHDHKCWDADVVDKIDSKKVLAKKSKKLDGSATLRILKGLDPSQVEVNDPGLSSHAPNQRRTYKPLPVGPLELPPPPPPAAEQRPPKDKKGKVTGEHSRPVLDLQALQGPRHPQTLNLGAVPTGTKPQSQQPGIQGVAKEPTLRQRLRKRPFVSSSRSASPVNPVREDAQKPALKSRKVRQPVGDHRLTMSGVSSVSLQENPTMDLKNHPGQWRFLNTQAGDELAKISLDSLSKAFLSLS